MATKREKENQFRMFETLRGLGVAYDDIVALRRISMTLHRWHEAECNGVIQRDETDNRPYWHNSGNRIGVAQDRETGARKRLATIMARYPALKAYVQGDPRGCALYIVRPSDVPEGQSIDSYYSRGIAVY